MKIVLAFVFVIGAMAFSLATGRAYLNAWLSVDRASNPIGFWLIQAFLSAIAAILAAEAVRSLFS